MDRDIATTSVQCLQSTYAQHQLHQGGAIGVCFLIGAGKSTSAFHQLHKVLCLIGPFVLFFELYYSSSSCLKNCQWVPSCMDTVTTYPLDN